MYAPAGVVNGDALGLVAVNGFETVADLDGSVRKQLIERGYLAGSGAGGPRQMVNHRRFLDVVDASYRETLADDLLGDGIWVPFEKESRSGGVERVMVRWIATTLPHTQPTYHGYTTDLGPHKTVGGVDHPGRRRPVPVRQRAQRDGVRWRVNWSLGGDAVGGG